MKSISALLIAISLCGCANIMTNTRPMARTRYVEPEEKQHPLNSTIVDASLDNAWKTLLQNIGKKGFVVDRSYKSSGLVVIKYNGDPEKYINCGTITHYTRSNNSDNTFEFPAAKAVQEYDYARDNQLFKVTRKVTLHTKSNIVLEEITAETTKITVISNYFVELAVVERDAAGVQVLRSQETTFFNTGETGYLIIGEQKLTCRANGRLEVDILSLAIQ